MSAKIEQPPILITIINDISIHYMKNHKTYSIPIPTFISYMLHQFLITTDVIIEQNTTVDKLNPKLNILSAYLSMKIFV